MCSFPFNNAIEIANKKLAEEIPEIKEKPTPAEKTKEKPAPKKAPAPAKETKKE